MFFSISPYSPKNELSNKSVYPITNYVSYDKVSTHFKCFLSKIYNIKEPSNYEAKNDPNWVEAKKEEI